MKNFLVQFYPVIPFSSFQRRWLEEVSPYTTRLSIDVDMHDGFIGIKGIPGDVVAATHDISTILLQRYEEVFALNMARTVSWVYEDLNDFKFTPYSVRINCSLEKAKLKNETCCTFSKSDGQCYVVDFEEMVEYQQSNKDNSTRVERRLPTVEGMWITGVR